MKKLCFIILVVLVSTTFIFSQNFSQENVKPTTEELTLKRYSNDTSASAAVLNDIGRSWFTTNADNNFIVIFERSTKIKIFTDAGLKYAQVEIPIYHEGNNFESISKINAVTYNYEDGRIIPTQMDITNKYTEKINDRWDVIKFALPNVKAGSVIEYKYSVTSPYLFNLHDWYFQSEIPVKYSKYRVEMIPFYEYTYLLQGANKFDEYNSFESTGVESHYGATSYHEKIHEYIMKNIPAFVKEGYIANSEDYLIKLDFQLSSYYTLSGIKTNVMSTWEDLITDILKYPDFGKYINSVEGRNKELIAGMIVEKKTKDEVIETIVDYVKANYNWNGQNSKYVIHLAKEFEKIKTGNSAEINLYLLGMLRDAGIEAEPVLLSTRENGKIKVDFPFLQFFNYVVILVHSDNSTYLVDATEPLLPYYLIPPKCLNDKGLLVVKKTNSWVELSNNKQSVCKSIFMTSFNSSLDSIKSTITISSTQYEAFNLRKEINDDSKKLEEYIGNKKYDYFTNQRTTNFYERNKPFSISYEIENGVEKIQNKIYLNPFLNEVITDNPFKQPDRKYPVDFTYPAQYEYFAVTNIPNGYKVEFLPKEKDINENSFILSYKALYNEEARTVTVSCIYNLKKAKYEAIEYRLLKYNFSELVNKLNEKIVLVKEN